jgi:hypothetical protein
MRTDRLTAKDFDLAMCQAVLFTPDEGVSAPLYRHCGESTERCAFHYRHAGMRRN